MDGIQDLLIAISLTVLIYVIYGLVKSAAESGVKEALDRFEKEKKRKID
jgi:hypothetical protein